MDNNKNSSKNLLQLSVSFMNFIVKCFAVIVLIFAWLFWYEMNFSEHYSEISQKEINDKILKITNKEFEIKKFCIHSEFK